MKIYQRLSLVLLASLLAGCVAAPFVWEAIQMLRSCSPALHRSLDFPFDRVMRRVVLVATVIFLLKERKSLEIVSLAGMGLRRTENWERLLAESWLLGAVSLTLMLALMLPFGARCLEKGYESSGGLLFGLGKAFIAGFAVAFIEEPIFRGFVLQSFMKSMRWARAVIIMSLFFAIVHFFNASDMPSPASFDILIGFKAIAYFFKPLLSPREVIPGFIGLFLVGVVLAYAYLRTGSLYPAIGLHAGWVFGIQAETLFLNRIKGIAPWFFGDGKVVTGVFGWLMLGVMLVFIRCLLPRNSERTR